VSKDCCGTSVYSAVHNIDHVLIMFNIAISIAAFLCTLANHTGVPELKFSSHTCLSFVFAVKIDHSMNGEEL